MADAINAILAQRTAPGGGKYTDFVPASEAGIANMFGPSTLDSAGIQAAINLASAAGGGIVQLQAATYNITTPIVPASGVAIRGVAPIYSYSISVPDTSSVLPNAGGTIFNCNGGDGFQWNKTVLGVPGSQVAFTLTALTNIEISNIGFINCATGINAGNTNNAACWYGIFYNLTAGAATGWLINITNFQHCMFERLYGFGCITGCMYFGNDVGAGTLQPGNSTFYDLYGATPTTNSNLSRGICHNVTQGIQNEATMARVQFNRNNATTVTQAATMANGQTNFTVTDGTKFAVTMPVAFSATVNGVTINQTYFVLSVATNTLTVATTVGGSAVSMTGATAVNITTQGFAALEFIALAGASIANQTVTNIDVEGGGTASIVLQNMNGSWLHVNQIPSAGTQSTATVCGRSVTASYVWVHQASNYDIDSLSNCFYNGYLIAGTPILNRAMPGMTSQTGVGVTLNLNSSLNNTFGLQGAAAGGNGYLLPIAGVGERIVVKNASSVTLSAADDGQVVNQFNTATWTLPTLASNLFNIRYKVVNANTTGNLTLSPGGAQVFNNIAARTSLILTPGAGCEIVGVWDGAIGYWAVTSMAGTYSAGTITGL